MRSRIVLFVLAAAPLLADVAAIRELMRAGRFDDAIAEADVALKTAAPAGVAPLRTLKGMAQQASGDRTAGLATLRRALAASPNYLPALQATAQIEFEARDPAARKTLEGIVRLQPANATAHAMLAELAFADRDCRRTLTHLAKMREKTPNARWQNGVCLFETERWREAAGEFSALLQLRDHAPTRFNLALSHWRANNVAATLDALGSLRDADAMSLRAAALRQQGDVPGALAVLQRGVREYPRDERLLVDLATLCLDQNAVALGIEVLEAGLANIPDSARLATALGVFHIRAGNAAKAEERFRQAERLSPDSGLGQVGVAMTMLQLGLAADAVKLLRGLRADAPMVPLTLARALVQKDPTPAERTEARDLLATILAREPGNAAAHSLLGRVLARQGDIAGAVREFEKALAADPADRIAANQLVQLYRKQGRNNDSARVAAKLRELLAKEKEAEAAAGRYRLARSATGL